MMSMRSLEMQAVTSLVVLALCTCDTTGQAPAADPGPLRVASYLVAPYLLYDTNATENATGNEQFTGFVKELLDAVSTEMMVDYEIHLADGYGSEQNGQWTGMIGEVVRKEADLAAGPLTVTLAREEAVDFTYPFQRTEATIVMSIRHFNQEPHIASLDDLVNQDVVAYGVAKDGPIYQFLKDSNTEVHEKMWDKMSTNTVLHFKEDNNKGVRRARTDSNYAFILDGALADWVMGQEPCDLEAIKTGFYQRQYAFAVENQSPLRDQVNVALVELEYSGVLDELRRKWLSPDMCAGAGSSDKLPLLVLAAIGVASVYFTRWQQL